MLEQYSGLRLGKTKKRHDDRTLQFRRYSATLPAPPAECFYQEKVKSWPMMLNDTLGDCVIAAYGHMVEQWTRYAQGAAGQVTATDAQVEAAYSAVGGYVPGDPATDNGCDMLTALAYWRNTGLAGHKIYAFVQLDASLTEIRQAISLFGNVYLGVQLPLSAQDQNQWFIDDTNPNNAIPGSWGGHCVPLVGYDTMNTCITWGMVLNMTTNFLLRYMDEAYAVLTTDWIEKNQKSPSGFDFAQLDADLAAIA